MHCHSSSWLAMIGAFLSSIVSARSCSLCSLLLYNSPFVVVVVVFIVCVFIVGIHTSGISISLCLAVGNSMFRIASLTQLEYQANGVSMNTIVCQWYPVYINRGSGIKIPEAFVHSLT